LFRLPRVIVFVEDTVGRSFKIFLRQVEVKFIAPENERLTYCEIFPIFNKDGTLLILIPPVNEEQSKF
jgi:hypothetical protein